MDQNSTRVRLHLPSGRTVEALLDQEHSPDDILAGLKEQGFLPAEEDCALWLFPNPQSALGRRIQPGDDIWLWSSSRESARQPANEPVFRGRNFQVEPYLCFVLMPFGPDDLQVVYQKFVKPVVEKCKLSCVRADDIYGTNPIMEDVWGGINHAGIIIAELTGRNPNVLYEVGIAHTLGRDVILLTQSMDDVPFDLRSMRVLKYEYTPAGCKRLEEELEKHLSALKRIQRKKTRPLKLSQ